MKHHDACLLASLLALAQARRMLVRIHALTPPTPLALLLGIPVERWDRQPPAVPIPGYVHVVRPALLLPDDPQVQSEV